MIYADARANSNQAERLERFDSCVGGASDHEFHEDFKHDFLSALRV